MVTPVARREAVAHLKVSFEVSERRACSVLGADRTSVRYRSIRPDDAAVRARLRELAPRRRRFGYRRLHVLLAREGISMNHKKLRRLYREERLQVRRRGGRKRALGTRAPLALPQGAQSALEPRLPVGCARRQPALPHPGDRRRLHARVPGAGRRHLAVRPAGRSRARHPHRHPRQAGYGGQRQRHRTDQHGDPALVAGEQASNGTTSPPASPSRMPSSRASTAGSATSCLNETLFTSLGHAREALPLWKLDYNTVRPHSRLGNLPPAEYAKLSACQMQRDEALSSWGAPRPVPLHHRANRAQMNSGLYPSLDERRGSDHYPPNNPRLRRLKRPKSTCAFWPQPKPKRKSLIDELTKPSGLSEEEKVKRRCTGSQTYFARIPRGRAINQMEAGWEKTPTGIFRRLTGIYSTVDVRK